MDRPREVTHALVDGVRYPRAFERLYGREDIADIEPLYLMTRWASLAEQGPILVRLHDTGLRNEGLREERGEWARAMTWLRSDASTEELADHLRQFVTFTAEGQYEKLLRFADPLVTRHWLASYGMAVPASVMGPISQWWVAIWSPNWEAASDLTWHAFQPEDSPRDAVVEDKRSLRGFMGPDQFAALDTVARWQFKERLATHFRDNAASAWQALPSEHRGKWLDTQIAQALAWGASTERQIAIWLDLSLHWGEDFMTTSDGLYARWVAQSAKAVGLPRQERLYALDAWSRSPEAMALHDNASQRSTSANEVFHG